METRNRSRSVRAVAAIVLFVASSALADDTARDLRDAALSDLRGITAAPPVQSHVQDAVRALERTQDAFVDGNHVSSSQVFERLGQAIDACAEGVRQARRRNDLPTADRLAADIDRLARAARLLASTLITDIQRRTFPIDRGSAARRDRRLDQGVPITVEGKTRHKESIGGRFHPGFAA